MTVRRWVWLGSQVMPSLTQNEDQVFGGSMEDVSPPLAPPQGLLCACQHRLSVIAMPVSEQCCCTSSPSSSLPLSLTALVACVPVCQFSGVRSSRCFGAVDFDMVGRDAIPVAPNMNPGAFNWA